MLMHSKDMNSLKSLYMKNRTAISTNVNKNSPVRVNILYNTMLTLINNASPSVGEAAAVVGSKDTSTKMKIEKNYYNKENNSIN